MGEFANRPHKGANGSTVWIFHPLDQALNFNFLLCDRKVFQLCSTPIRRSKNSAIPSMRTTEQTGADYFKVKKSSNDLTVDVGLNLS